MTMTDVEATVESPADNPPAVVTVFAWAEMEPRYETRKVKRQIGTEMVKKTKGLLFKSEVEVETPTFETVEETFLAGRSETRVDLEDLAQKTAALCDRLAADGYDVVSITPVQSGRFKTDRGHSWVSRIGHQGKNVPEKWGSDPGYGAVWSWGYGYSVTDGVMVTGRWRRAV
jgi:hypothetical protein